MSEIDQATGPVARPQRNAAWRYVSLVLLVLDLTLLGWTMIVEIPDVPKERAYFDSLRSQLPSPTLLVIGIPQSVYYVIGLAILAGLIGKEFLPDKRVTAAVNAGVALLLAGGTFFMQVALSLPNIPLRP